MTLLKIVFASTLFFNIVTLSAQEEMAEAYENSLTETEEIIEKVSPAQKAFDKLDFNLDGSVDFKEFQKVNMNVKRKNKNYSVAALEVSKRFSAIDGNKDNKIELYELEISMIPERERKYLLKKHEIFSKIDLSNNDEIDFEEFKRIKSMGKMIKYRRGTDEEKEKKFSKFDKNNDSIIDFEEFEIDKKIIGK